MNLPLIGKPVPRVTDEDEIQLALQAAHKVCQQEDEQRRRENRHFSETRWPVFEQAWKEYTKQVRNNPDILI